MSRTALDRSMRRAAERVGRLLLEEGKRAATEHLAEVRPTCRHAHAYTLVSGERGSLRVCPWCMRLVVHNDGPT